MMVEVDIMVHQGGMGEEETHQKCQKNKCYVLRAISLVIT
jgi:hypothetical protein